MFEYLYLLLILYLFNTFSKNKNKVIIKNSIPMTLYYRSSLNLKKPIK